MRPTLILTLLIASFATPAAAAIVVEVGNAGRSCYEATLTTSSPESDRSAIATCNEAVANAARAHDQAAAYVNRSDIRLRMQDYDAAMTDAEKAMALEPSLGVAHFNRAAAMVGMKRDNEALTALDETLTLGGVDPELVYYNRAVVNEHMGDIKGAYLNYRKALAANPKFQRAAEQLTRFQVTAR